MRPRALDLFCRAGGISEGLRRAGFDVVGVDILDCEKAYNKGPGNPAHENPARFVQDDALSYPLEGFDLICASPPCQAHSILRKMTGKEYPDLIPATRERLRSSGVPWCIENVAGAPLAAESLLLCGSMFGLAVPDGRAELRRHRLFEASFPVTLRPGCRHGDREAVTIAGHARNGGRGRAANRRVITVTGERCNSANNSKVKYTYATEEARHAMGISWMAMKDLSQAIPPVYGHFLGLMFLGKDPTHLLAEGGCMGSLF